MPMSVALFDAESGKPIEGTGKTLQTFFKPTLFMFLGQPEVLTLTDRQHSFTFSNVQNPPVLSLNREFTAPVYIQYPQSLDDMALLTMHDTDSFNKYSHCQKMMSLHIVSKYCNSSHNIFFAFFFSFTIFK